MFLPNLSRIAVPQFRVIIQDLDSEVDRVAATVDSLSEALALVRALHDHQPRIEWKRPLGSGEADGADEWARTTFTPRERADIEAMYLGARAEMKAAGVSDATIDRIVPVTADGSVPWE